MEAVPEQSDIANTADIPPFQHHTDAVCNPADGGLNW